MRRLLVLVSVFLFALTVSLSVPNNGRADTQGGVQATLTIIVNRNISINDISVIEGETAFFTVSLSGEADEQITVDYSTVGGTAVAGEDYISTSGTVTFQPGETTATVTVQTLEDSTIEDDKTFYLDLSNPQGPAKIADGRGVGTIADNDSNPASIIISNDTQYEGNPEEFVVALSNPVTEAVTVQYYTSDETAVSGEDYEGIPKTSPLTLTFQPGELEKTVTIDTFEDISHEPEQIFQLILENASGPAVILDGQGEGIILDDDPASSDEAGAGGEAEEKQAGAAGEAETAQKCTPICPPALPLLKATKEDQLSVDKNNNGLADEGDVIQYSVVIGNVAGTNPGKLTYIEPLSPYLEVEKTSLSTNSTDIQLDNAGSSTVLRADLQKNTGQLEFPLKLEYEARVDKNLPEGLAYINGQGVVYSSNYPTVVTDDPFTPLIDDSTWTPVSTEGTLQAKANELRDRKLIFSKSIITRETNTEASEEGNSCVSCSSDTLPSKIAKRIAEDGTEIQFGVKVRNNTGERVEALKLINPIDRHLEFKSGSVKLNGGSISPGYDKASGLVYLELPSLAPGETVDISYWTNFTKQELPADLGYFGNRAYLIYEGGRLELSDDPETKLIDDPTAVLLPSRCDQNNYQDGWRKWFDRLNKIESGLLPLVVTSRHKQGGNAGGAGKEQEKNGSLTWVMINKDSNNMFNTNDATEEFARQLQSSNILPRYSFLGTAKFDIEPGLGKLFLERKPRNDLAGKGGATKKNSTERSFYVQGFGKKSIFKKVSGGGKLTPLNSGSGSDEIPWCSSGYLPFISDLSTGNQIELNKLSEMFLNLYRLEGKRENL